MALQTQERPSGIYDDKPVPKNQDADEIRSLEDAYAADAATDADLPENHPSRGVEQVRDAESSVTPASDDSKEDGGDFAYTPEKKGKIAGKSFFGSRKNIAVTAFVSLILSAVTFFATIATGPLQFVHLTNLMDRFHFSSQREDGSSRLMKIAKAIRNKDKPQDNRLSLLGNKIADKWEGRMKAAGFIPEYNGRTGYFERYVIDREAIMNNSELEGLKNNTNEEIRSHFKTQYDIDIDIDIAGRPVIEASGMGYFRTQRLNRLVFNSSGYSKMGSAIRTRTISKRQGITWHPIKKLDRAALEQVDKFLTWRENRKNKLQSGESADATTRISAGDTPDEAGAADSEKVKSATDAVIAEANAAAAESTASGSSRFSDFANRPSVKATGVATMVMGLACMAEGIASEYDSIQYQNSAQPMMRLAADAMATGSQIQATLMQGKPLDIEQLGYLSKSLNKDGQSWLSAKSIQAQAGQEQTGPDIPDEARINIEGSAVSQFLSAFPGLSGTCKALNSAVGQAAGFVFDVVTGPASALVGFAAGQTVVPAATDKLLNMITDDPLNLVDAAGGEFGSYVDTGSRLLANESALASGGRALTNSESAQLTVRRLALENEEMSRLPLATRLFDATNERSLIGKLASAQSTGIKGSLSRAVQQITNPTSSVLSLRNIFQSPTALAATSSYDYGFPQIGFSTTEIEDPKFDNSLDQATTNALASDSLRERAEKCFGVKISSSPDRTVLTTENTPNYKDIADNNCNDSSDDWTRVRFFILDSQIAESYACYEGVDEESCANIGMAASTQATPGSTGGDSVASPPPSGSAPEVVDPSRLGYSTENISCAPGTNDLGVVISRYRGSLKKESGDLRVRLCQIVDIPGEGNNTQGREIPGGAVVDAYVSAAWAALARDAKAAGISLRANSSFRLADSCGGTGDGGRCARPGQSPHQTGWAIDFANMSKLGPSSTSCSARATLPGNAAWEWMKNNAPRYGIKQYTKEAWHWDPMPMENRCG